VPTVALACCSGMADLGGELALLAPGLERAGLSCEPVVWDDAGVDWSAFDGMVVRATWDYTGRIEDFRAWVRSVAATTPVANPPDVLVWNGDKRYLDDLAAAGVPVVDTRFLEPGGPVELPDWPELVVKPAVSAGARRTGRFTAGERGEALSLVAAIHAEGTTAMVQPFLEAVDRDGEIDVVAFAGEPSHAVAKGGLLPAEPTWADDTSRVLGEWSRPEPLTAELAAFARHALAAVPSDETLLYARVDSALDADGTRRLMELELVEPYLFLAAAPDPAAAADRFAAATRRWLGDH